MSTNHRFSPFRFARLAIALLVASAASARATIVTLDLTSGTDSITNGGIIAADTYEEAGFKLRMDRFGDHYDRGFVGDLGFHNGPANPDNITWTLTFGGSAFSLLSVDIAGFTNSASSITVTGSNGAFQSLSTVGENAVAGLAGVTFVTFNIDQDGGIESVGLNGLTVDNAPVATPDTASSLLLVAMGLTALVLARRKAA